MLALALALALGLVLPLHPLDLLPLPLLSLALALALPLHLLDLLPVLSLGLGLPLALGLLRELAALLRVALPSLLLALPLHPLGLLRELAALLREALVALLLVPGSRYREALRTDEQEVGSSAGWVHVPRAVFM